LFFQHCVTIPGKKRIIFAATYKKSASGFIVVGFIQAPLQTGFFLQTFAHWNILEQEIAQISVLYAILAQPSKV
jgi:hypothetical protein